MAIVTVELRNLLKTDFELFDFDYSFDDQNFKQELEQAVIDYYYFYEIGQETPDQFKHVFKSKWLSAIGYYNNLHNTTLLEYNPLINYKMDEALNELSNASNSQNTTTTGSADENVSTDEITSDYPQQPIAGGNYASGQRVAESGTNVSSQDRSEQSGNTENNREYEKTIEGLTGTSYQELIVKERENMIRIKSMIIEELKPCFILIY